VDLETKMTSIMLRTRFKMCTLMLVHALNRVSKASADRRVQYTTETISGCRELCQNILVPMNLVENAHRCRLCSREASREIVAAWALPTKASSEEACESRPASRPGPDASIEQLAISLSGWRKKECEWPKGRSNLSGLHSTRSCCT
jgi:hypothetical protein